MPTLEGLRLKYRNYIYIPLTRNKRNKMLENKEFTIISNNCWGGSIYEAYDLKKQSPTVGLFFMASDYIKFVSRLKEFLEAELNFIRPEKSKWKNSKFICGDKRFGSYPIGVLNNHDESIEIFFLHYNSEDEAKIKWQRRVDRICWEQLIIKFNDQNGCTQNDVELFCRLPYENKIFFTSKKWAIESDIIKMIPVNFNNADHILASYEPIGKNKVVDINALLNSFKYKKI